MRQKTERHQEDAERTIRSTRRQSAGRCGDCNYGVVCRVIFMVLRVIRCREIGSPPATVQRVRPVTQTTSSFCLERDVVKLLKQKLTREGYRQRHEQQYMQAGNQ